MFSKKVTMLGRTVHLAYRLTLAEFCAKFGYTLYDAWFEQSWHLASKPTKQKLPDGRWEHRRYVMIDASAYNPKIQERSGIKTRTLFIAYSQNGKNQGLQWHPVTMDRIFGMVVDTQVDFEVKTDDSGSSYLAHTTDRPSGVYETPSILAGHPHGEEIQE